MLAAVAEYARAPPKELTEYKNQYEPLAPLAFWEQLLDCFGPVRNWQNYCGLRNVATNSLDGMRTWSMSWVVFGHTLLWPLMGGNGYSNLDRIIPITPGTTALMGTWTGQVVQSAEFSVDTFFYMSGFLATFVGLKKLGKLQPLQVILKAPLMYLDRWLRLTPLVMFIIWCYVYVVPVLEEGPYWKIADAEACKEYWWQNILYIQTIFAALGLGGKGSGGCYGVTWYLADDMMFFYLVPFMIALAGAGAQKAWLALASIGTLWTASILYTLIAASENHWSAGTFDTSDYGKLYYQPPWTRCPPYLMGAAFGIIWFRWNKPISDTLTARPWLRLAVFILSGFLLSSTVYGLAAYSTTVPSTTPSGLMVAYVTFSKSAWTLGLVLLNLLCFSNHGHGIQWILELPLFGYLGKLSYSMYLLHPTVLALLLYGDVAPTHYSIVNFTRNYVAALALTTSGGLLLHLFVELPFSNLVVLFMSSLRRPAKSLPQLPPLEELEHNLLEEGSLPNSSEFPAAESRRNTAGSDTREPRRDTTEMLASSQADDPNSPGFPAAESHHETDEAARV